MSKIPSTSGSNTNPKISTGYHKFTFDPKYSKITVAWLNRIAHLPTRDFVIELMAKLFDPKEITNCSATGVLPINSKIKDKKEKNAVDPDKRQFIEGIITYISNHNNKIF